VSLGDQWCAAGIIACGEGNVCFLLLAVARALPTPINPQPKLRAFKLAFPKKCNLAGIDWEAIMVSFPSLLLP
jgi:hypothetical protein